MTRRHCPKGTSLCLKALAMCYLFAGSNIVFVLAEAEPLPPAMIYGDNLTEDAENLMLLNRLKQVTERKQEVIEQERELTEEQVAIQALLEAKAGGDGQPYPPKMANQGMSGPPVSRTRPSSFLYSQQPKRRVHPNTRVNWPDDRTRNDPRLVIKRGNNEANADEQKELDMSLCYFKICNMGRKRQM